MNERTHARHLAQLGFLQQVLDDQGLSTNLAERSEDVPIHILLAGVTVDRQGRDRVLQFNLLPLDEEDMQATELLQIYSAMPFQLKADRRGELAKLIVAINGRSPIGHVGISDANEIHYRYVYAQSSSRTFDKEEMLEVLSLFIHMLDMFAEVLEQVAGGTIDADTAIAELR